MKKHFICLANSFKYAGRCLGGIEIEMKDNKYTIVRNENPEFKQTMQQCRIHC